MAGASSPQAREVDRGAGADVLEVSAKSEGSDGAVSSRACAGAASRGMTACQLDEDAAADAALAAALSIEDGGGGGSGSGAKAARSSALDDPLLALPTPSRADWQAEMESIRKLVEDSDAPDEEKVNVLYEALTQRIEDTRTQEESKAGALRRVAEAGKERDRYRTEVQRAVAVKAKLEASCRELQQKKSSYARENQRIAEEERSRHAELKEKFQQAIKDVQEKMDAELEGQVRQHFLRENEELRGKLLKFTETYEAQERQLAEQREARGREMEVAQQRLKEHESMCSESKVKAAGLEKQNEVLRKSQQVLRDELQSILGKFDEFHDAVAGSNQRHGECKVEIDSLQARLQELEKENGELRNSSELSQLTQEQQVAQKQRDALDRLCDNLQKENKKLQEQLQGLRKGVERDKGQKS